MSAYSQKVIQRRDLLAEFVRTNIKLRYKNSVLGLVWVLLKPLLTFLVLYVVWGGFNRGTIAGAPRQENFAIYLLIGNAIYFFFSECLTFGMNALLEKSHIILKVNFDRSVAIESALIQAGINFLLNLVVLLVFFVFNPVQITVLSLVYFFAVILVLFLLMFGLAYFTSILMLQLRDLETLTPILLQLIFFATPIFFSVGVLPDWMQQLMRYNPLYIIIDSARSAIMFGQIVNVEKILLIAAAAVVIFLSGRIYFSRNVKRIAEYF